MLKLEKLMNKPARLLSGGEMQRVAIARAVVVSPLILIADEPTGNLDHSSSIMVMECFQALNKQGITILMATHNESLLGYCSRTLVFADGMLKKDSDK
jgi:ABC-type ATPase involved in cell division